RTKVVAIAFLDLDVMHKAKPAPMDRLDVALHRAIVADKLPYRFNPATEGCIGDESALPNDLKQLLLCDDAMSILKKEDQEIEHLRFNGQAFAGAIDFKLLRVDRVPIEMEDHNAELKDPSPPILACAGRRHDDQSDPTWSR
ncbi:MAG TPA: hypothetical protein VJ955_01035, partial [Desulfuromonadales bacterium]|nr:hypothetical protein [Desulfuromonadales bacterium]